MYGGGGGGGGWYNCPRTTDTNLLPPVPPPDSTHPQLVVLGQVAADDGRVEYRGQSALAGTVTTRTA